MAKTGWVWDGTQFVALTAPVGAFPNAVANYGTATPTGTNTGQIWFNSTNNSLNVWSGSSWIVSDPAFNIDETTDTFIADYTLTYNGMSVGPMQINSGFTVTVPVGKVWSII